MKKYIVVVNDVGVFWYTEGGVLHRENGPAVEWYDGTNSWYKHGKLHRENGPAIVQANSYVEWRINGLRHREEGPAIEYADGRREWYLNSKRLTEDEFNSRNKKELTIAEIEALLGYSIKIVKG